MLGGFAATIIAFARAHQGIAYGLIVLVAFSESLPVIGAFVPGDAIILGISALVPTGALRLWPLILGALAGAVLGDGFSFWLGRHYRAAILERWPFRAHARLVSRGTTFLQRHGGKSVFVARFTPGVRAIVPVLGGILQMDVVRFILMNVFSALLWAPVHILAGALLGASFVLLGAVAGRLALIAAIVLGLLGVLYASVHYLVRRVPPLALGAQARLRLWAGERESWFARALLAVLDPSRRELPGLALLGAIVLSSLWLFFGVLQDVIAGDPLVRANRAVFHFLQGLRTEWVDQVMVAITELGDAPVVAGVTFVTLAWLAWRRNWRAVAHLIALVAIAGLVTVVLKVSLHVQRPEHIDTGWDAFAFPSGHSVASAALYGFLAIIMAREINVRWRLPVTGALALLVGAIAFSRVYLGAHWLSDVLAGIAFGVAAAALLGIAYLQHNPPRVGAVGLGVTVAVALLVAGAVHIEDRHAADMRRYAVRRHTQFMPLAAWWRRDWMRLPARRVDLIGGAEEPLTFQWAGRRAALARELAVHGWHAPPRWTTRTAVRWLEPHAVVMSLPVLSHLENGHREALVLVHAAAVRPHQQRFVLRLWRSNVELTGAAPTRVRLFVGAVVEERATRVADIMTVTHDLREYDVPRNVLAGALARSRLVARSGTRLGAAWDGCVLLAQANSAAARERREAAQARSLRPLTTPITATSRRSNRTAPCAKP